MICETCPLNRKPVKPLTARQLQVLRYMHGYLVRTGIMPTYAEMCDALGMKSLATIVEHMENLERKGWVERYHNTLRGRALTPAAVVWIHEHPEPNHDE